jgi:hypothetical protein
MMVRDHLENQGADGRIILKKTSRNRIRAWTVLMWLKIWICGGLL